MADGGYLYAKDGARLERGLPRSENHARMGFVLGCLERPAGEFFAEASANNGRFNGESMTFMLLVTENITRAIDYECARKHREENWFCERPGDQNPLDLRMTGARACICASPRKQMGRGRGLRKRPYSYLSPDPTNMTMQRLRA